MKLKFVLPTDPILSAIVPAYVGNPHALRPLASAMWRVMRENCMANYDARMQMEMIGHQVKITNGIGIAAPQVGHAVNMFVMQLTGKRFDEAYVCINPTVVAFSPATAVDGESCMTKPDYDKLVERPVSIAAEWSTLKGSLRKATLYGLAARCFLHELDHLNGVTLWQR